MKELGSSTVSQASTFISKLSHFRVRNTKKMAANQRLSSHSRSISLPSSSHPLIANFEEHLLRLKSSADASTSSSSHTLACQRLDGLKKLYECVDDVLQLPLSQQALSHGEEILEGSLRLLDICGAVRDIYSQMKETVHDLESSLRRKSEIQTYTISKKNLNKMVTKCYKEIKNLTVVKKESSSETAPLLNLMKQVQEASLIVLEATLSVISPSKQRQSLVSKFLQQKKTSSQELPLTEKVQVELKSYNEGDIAQMRNVVKSLEEIDSSIQELEEILDIVFRLLVKSRVSLLNIFSH